MGKTPFETKIDIPLMLWRLQPTAEFHWKGNGFGTYADIGEWRSPEIPKPTEAEIYAEWDQYRVEQEGVEEKKAETQGRVKAALGDVKKMKLTDLDGLTSAQTKALLIAVLHRLGAIQADGSIVLGMVE